jgi:hypothetical protein
VASSISSRPGATPTSDGRLLLTKTPPSLASPSDAMAHLTRSVGCCPGPPRPTSWLTSLVSPSPHSLRGRLNERSARPNPNVGFLSVLPGPGENVRLLGSQAEGDGGGSGAAIKLPSRFLHAAGDSRADAESATAFHLTPPLRTTARRQEAMALLQALAAQVKRASPVLSSGSLRKLDARLC